MSPGDRALRCGCCSGVLPLPALRHGRLLHPQPDPGRSHAGRRGPTCSPTTRCIRRSSRRCLLAVLTVVAMLIVLVPTMIWVRLRTPWAKGAVEFLCLLPLTIPALVIVVGLKNVYLWVTYLLGESALTLTFVYVVVVLPFAYRAIDAALSAIDLAHAGGGGALARRGLDRRPSCASWCPTSGRASSRPRSSPWPSCSASTPSPRCPDSRPCRFRSSRSARATGPLRWRPRWPRLLFGFVLLLALSLLTRRRRPV